jgi:hypothetical protein
MTITHQPSTITSVTNQPTLLIYSMYQAVYNNIQTHQPPTITSVTNQPTLLICSMYQAVYTTIYNHTNLNYHLITSPLTYLAYFSNTDNPCTCFFSRFVSMYMTELFFIIISRYLGFETRSYARVEDFQIISPVYIYIYACCLFT